MSETTTVDQILAKAEDEAIEAAKTAQYAYSVNDPSAPTAQANASSALALVLAARSIVLELRADRQTPVSFELAAGCMSEGDKRPALIVDVETKDIRPCNGNRDNCPIRVENREACRGNIGPVPCPMLEKRK